MVSWQRVHRRYELVHAGLEEYERSGRIPAALRSEIDAEFGSLGEFLREVQVRWYRAFNARLDVILENPPRDPRAALVRLELDLAKAMPETARYLEAHADDPVLADLTAAHLRRLKEATGVTLLGAAEDAPVAARAKRHCGLLAFRRFRAA